MIRSTRVAVATTSYFEQPHDSLHVSKHTPKCLEQSPFANRPRPITARSTCPAAADLHRIRGLRNPQPRASNACDLLSGLGLTISFTASITGQKQKREKPLFTHWYKVPEPRALFFVVRSRQKMMQTMDGPRY